MIPQDVRIQNVVRFWKSELTREIKRDLRLTLGLVKSMVANAYEEYGEKDDSGLYYAAILAEERIYDLHQSLETKISDAFDDVILALDKSQSES